MRTVALRRATLTMVTSVLLGGAGLGCGSSSSGFSGDGGTVDGSMLDATRVRPHDGASDGPPNLLTNQPVYVSLSIAPANPTIVVNNGVVPPPTTFSVSGKTKTGATTKLSGVWSFDRPDIGAVDGSGAFHPTGQVGGTGTLTATANGLKATTSVTVVLQMTLDPGGVSTTLRPFFAAATMPDPMLALDYPYDQTIFPRGLPGPIAQWCLGAAPACTGNATDVYDIKLTAAGATFEAFTTTSTPTAPSFTLPTMPVDVWSTLTSSTAGTLTFSIARFDGTTAYTPITQTWTIAAANLAGTIYYWEVDLGTVVKLPLGQAPAQFLQIPTETPAITCVACHSVSKNGSTVVAAFNGSASPWGTVDTSTGTSIFVDGTDSTNGPAGSGFEAISPDGSWLLWGQEQDVAYLSLNPSNSATSSPTQLNPGVGNPAQPAWSPDGKHIAFADRTAPGENWLDYTTSDLWTTEVDVTASPPTFTSTQKIVSNAAPTRPTTTYPSFSPDSEWIAFERSTQSRSRGAESELWLTSIDGATQIALTAANTGTGLYTQTNATYEPTFMPVAVGGYFWLVFVSERVYGNTLTSIDEGTSAAPGRHKQLWVTAIDANPVAGKDPSHPAFWLPGQNTVDQNMRGEWALDPCKATGASCSGGYECCAGFCVVGDGGASVCTSQSGGCSGSGDACKTSSDCCDTSASCVGGFCNVSPK